MLLRLLGLEDEALAFTGDSPFTDVPGWAAPYTSYAKAQGLTNGIGGTSYAPALTLDAGSYVTFLLRGLGYSEAAGDFTWDKSLEFAASLSLISEDSAASMKGLPLTRGDMVDLSYAALTHTMKGSERTLAVKLCDDGVFSYQAGLDTAILSAATQTYQYAPPQPEEPQGEAIVQSASTPGRELTATLQVFVND